mmetsp:Transcript_10417/g.21003  ORF Transcript_10417/g.21003 Transcript_10417/m.21003 type:complete len:120 (+) Transcript_10417:107-466(+)
MTQPEFLKLQSLYCKGRPELGVRESSGIGGRGAKHMRCAYQMHLRNLSERGSLCLLSWCPYILLSIERKSSRQGFEDAVNVVVNNWKSIPSVIACRRRSICTRNWFCNDGIQPSNRKLP